MPEGENFMGKVRDAIIATALIIFIIVIVVMYML